MLKTELNGANSSASRSQEGLNGGAPNTVIKGLVIDGFANTDGIGILPDSGTLRNVRIEGNFVGTDPSGTQALGNHPDGVSLFQTSDSTVGGDSPDKRNLISGNEFAGVDIEGFAFEGGSSNNNTVQGNLIGLAKDGATPLGNGLKNNVGGAAGVDVLGDAATGNRILPNSISSNGGPGIDLGDFDPNGPTANDSGDGDTGANDLQNFPVLSSAVPFGNQTFVSGTLDSTPGL